MYHAAPQPPETKVHPHSAGCFQLDGRGGLTGAHCFLFKQAQVVCPGQGMLAGGVGMSICHLSQQYHLDSLKLHEELYLTPF